MRYLLYLAFAFLISCKEKIGESVKGFFSNREFYLDTVLINPGDEIIFLRHQLLNADISKDGKYLYNFNENDVTIEKINLDELRLEEKFPFEREGPNGIGAGVQMKVHNEKQVTMTGMFQSSLFSLEGEKLMTVYFENFSLGGHPMEGGEQLRKSSVDTDAKRLYGLIHRYRDNSFVLGVLHLEDFEISKIELKSFERLPDYSFDYKLGTGLISRLPQVDIDQFGPKLILSNGITNALMWYDTETDSLFMKSYSSNLTANQKEKDYKKKHETSEQFRVEYGRYKQEINFMSPFWDKDRRCFYRFSYEENGGKAKVYLTAYDEELNQIGETLVPQLTKRPARHFAKDGKIWVYENMDDEMAFVRLGMSESNGKEDV